MADLQAPVVKDYEAGADERRFLRDVVRGLVDLEEILAYYTEQRVRDVGARILGEILSKIQRLRSHPDRGRIVPEFGLTQIRELIHPPFRIVYRRDPGAVQIVRVLRSERLLKNPD